MEKKLIIRKTDLEPSRRELSVLGVFNPAVVKVGTETIMLARVAEIAKNSEAKYFIIPTYKNREINYIKIDRFSPDYDFTDARVIRNHEQNYLTSISHLRLARSDDGINFIFTNTRIMPETDYEAFGIEDPRITEIEGRYYITYSAISEHGVNVALMVTKDFHTFERLGIILPFDNKDCVIFPRSISGRYRMLHRPSKSDFAHLDIWTAESVDLEHWGNHHIITKARPTYQNCVRVGAGAVPFLTERGWVVVYHAADDKHRYHLASMLLDANNPNRVLMRSAKPLISATEEYEKNGFFRDVVFTCGLTRDGDDITIYYGVCDENIAMCKMKLAEIYANMEDVSHV